MNKINKKGFTIIELLVVISIIGLLSTISVVVLNGARIKNRDTRRLADMKQLSTALELYFDIYGEYPNPGANVVLGTTSYGKLCDKNAGAGNGVGFVSSSTTCTITYLGVVPINPGPTGGTDYTYNRVSNISYTTTFTLEEKNGELAKGLRTLTQEGIK